MEELESHVKQFEVRLDAAVEKLQDQMKPAQEDADGLNERDAQVMERAQWRR